MSIIGELAVNVAMKTLGFDKSKRRVRSGMRDMALAAKRATAAFRGMAGALGVGLGVGSIAFALKRTAEQLDSLAKTSRKLGLAAQQLDGLRFAAGQTGVAANTLDMALQRMVRRVSEAASGTGEAKDAIVELRLSAQDLNQLAPDEQFLRIAEAMRGVSGQTDKVRLAFKLFDSEGVALVNTLGEGSAKIREMMEEAKKLSGTLDDSTLKQVERFNDELARLMKLTKSFGQKIIIDIAPAASDFLEGVQALVAFHKTGEFSPIKDIKPEASFRRKAAMTPEERSKSARQTLRKFGLKSQAEIPRQFLGKKVNAALAGIGSTFERGIAAVGQGVRGAQMALAVEALKQQLGPGRAAEVLPNAVGAKSKESQRKQVGSLASLSAFESESVRGFRALRQNLRKDEERLGLDKTRNQTLDRIAIASEKFAEELENLGQNETVTIPPA